MSNINVAKRTFDAPKSSGSASDYLKNKKSKMMYCNRQGVCNNKGVSSYADKALIANGRMIEEPIPVITNDLYSNLTTQLDYSGDKLLTDISGNQNVITGIDLTLVPFYYSYQVDPDGVMFGTSECNYNTFINSRVNYVPMPPQTVYKN